MPSRQPQGNDLEGECNEENLDKLHTMSHLLLQYETIDAPQIDAIMEGREPPPPMGWNKAGKDDDKPESRPLPPIGGPAAQT